MNSLPTPESSPAGQFGKADAKKLKNAESEKKTSKKVRRRDTRLSRSLPGLNQSAKIANTIRPKSLFPKVALIISPKVSKLSSVQERNSIQLDLVSKFLSSFFRVFWDFNQLLSGLFGFLFVYIIFFRDLYKYLQFHFFFICLAFSFIFYFCVL